MRLMTKLTPYIQALDSGLSAANENDLDALGELVTWAVAQASSSGELTDNQLDDLRGLSGLGGRVGCSAVAGYLVGVIHDAKEEAVTGMRNALGGMLSGALAVDGEQPAAAALTVAGNAQPTGMYL